MVATHNIGLDADDEKYWSTLYHKGDNNFTDSDINLFYFAKNLYRGLKQKDVTSRMYSTISVSTNHSNITIPFHFIQKK